MLSDWDWAQETKTNLISRETEQEGKCVLSSDTCFPESLTHTLYGALVRQADPYTAWFCMGDHEAQLEYTEFYRMLLPYS